MLAGLFLARSRAGTLFYVMCQHAIFYFEILKYPFDSGILICSWMSPSTQTSSSTVRECWEMHFTIYLPI
jgi:hypothetical protein